MSSFEIFKSMFITPRKKLKRARMTKFKSIYDFKTENFLCPIDNKDKNLFSFISSHSKQKIYYRI